MTIKDFWELIEKVKEDEEPEESIKPILAKLTQPELISYQEHFDSLHEKAYSWPLWGAAYILEGGCSDDGFTDFRYALISRGREIYEAALGDPDSIADLSEQSIPVSNELFGYAALDVYEEKSNEEMPRNYSGSTQSPTGTEWDFDDEDDNRKHLPKLFAKFWGKY